MTIEAVLILTLMVSLIFAITRTIKQKQYLTKLVEKPWSYIAGMVENAYWSPVDDGRRYHPNQISRHGSPEGDLL